MSTQRQLHLNAFLFGTGHHRASWRRPDSPVEQLGDISYWEHLARIAERGLFDAVFFADGHSVDDVASGPRWFLEPLTALSAMARATERVGLVCTISTTFFTPFHAARMLASLDHCVPLVRPCSVMGQGRIPSRHIESLTFTYRSAELAPLRVPHSI